MHSYKASVYCIHATPRWQHQWLCIHHPTSHISISNFFPLSTSLHHPFLLNTYIWYPCERAVCNTSRLRTPALQWNTILLSPFDGFGLPYFAWNSASSRVRASSTCPTEKEMGKESQVMKWDESEFGNMTFIQFLFNKQTQEESHFVYYYQVGT